MCEDRDSESETVSVRQHVWKMCHTYTTKDFAGMLTGGSGLFGDACGDVLAGECITGWFLQPAALSLSAFVLSRWCLLQSSGGGGGGDGVIDWEDGE